MEAILIAEGIRSFFPEAGPFSLTLKKGDRCYVQGREEGCDCLFEMLTGLRKPQEGSVTLLGQDLYALSGPERAAILGAIPKNGGFLPELTLLEQIRLPMVLAGLPGEEIRSRIRKNAPEQLPLHRLYDPAGRCTPRALALAALLRGVVMAPQVLICNAPFRSLSGKDAELVWKAVNTMTPTLLCLGSDPTPAHLDWTAQISLR